MGKAAEVIVTYHCSRQCGDCPAVNRTRNGAETGTEPIPEDGAEERNGTGEETADIPEVVFGDLLGYDEITISGGEPMLIGPRVVEMIHRLRAHGYTGKIYLRSAGIDVKRWDGKLILKEVDGIRYSVPKDCKTRDVNTFRRLTEYLKTLARPDMHNTLTIDPETADKYDLRDCDPDVWAEINPETDGICAWLGTERQPVFYDLEKE